MECRFTSCLRCISSQAIFSFFSSSICSFLNPKPANISIVRSPTIGSALLGWPGHPIRWIWTALIFYIGGISTSALCKPLIQFPSFLFSKPRTITITLDVSHIPGTRRWGSATTKSFFFEDPKRLNSTPPFAADFLRRT